MLLLITAFIQQYGSMDIHVLQKKRRSRIRIKESRKVKHVLADLLLKIISYLKNTFSICFGESVQKSIGIK